MRADLRAILTVAPSVTSLVGSRVYWGERPQGTPLPAVMLTVISGGTDYHLAGESGLFQDRVQVDCYADSYSTSISMRNAVRSLLSNYSGTQGTTAFQLIHHVGEREFREAGETTGAGTTFRVSLDFMVHYGETP